PVRFSDPGGTYSKENEAYLQGATVVSSTPFKDRRDEPHYFFRVPKDFEGPGGFVGELTDKHLDRFREAGARAFRYQPPGETDQPDFRDASAEPEASGEGAAVPKAVKDAAVGTALQANKTAADSVQRLALQDQIGAVRDELLEQVGDKSDEALRKEAVTKRNEATLKTREKLSHLGRGASEGQKPSNKLPTVEGEVAKRTARVDADVQAGKRPPFPDESARQRGITQEVIKGGGRGNQGVNLGARAARGLGPALLALGVGIAVNEVIQAPEGDRARTAARETLVLGAGFAASAGVGLAATALATAGVISLPALAVVGIGFAVGAVVAIGTSMLFDYLVPRSQ